MKGWIKVLTIENFWDSGEVDDNSEGGELWSDELPVDRHVVIWSAVSRVCILRQLYEFSGTSKVNLSVG